MKVFIINGNAKISSWQICQNISEALTKRGNQVYVATPDEKPHDCNFNYYQIGNNINRRFNRLLTHLDGSDGFRNYLVTRKLIRYINKIKPDVVHLHTLHGYFINVSLLLTYLKDNHIKTIITCHDCWWFTGRCAHFFKDNCDKWQTLCQNCQHKANYPKTILIDRSKKYFLLKKRIFAAYDNLIITCVSNWLTNLCSQSPFFQNKRLVTIYNGVDPSVFQLKKIREKSSQINLISVANQWGKSKGLDMILDLANNFPTINFTLVGQINSNIHLPKNINHLERTLTIQELNDLYCAHDALLNCSKQETFSLINIEAQMCGLPVICLADTGCLETIDLQNSFPVERYDLASFSAVIKKFLELKDNINHQALREFSERFSKDIMVESYLKLYDKDY